MRVPRVYQDRIGLWVWEVLNEDGMYFRAERSFMQEHDARKDLDNSTYLIRSELTLN